VVIITRSCIAVAFTNCQYPDTLCYMQVYVFRWNQIKLMHLKNAVKIEEVRLDGLQIIN